MTFVKSGWKTIAMVGAAIGLLFASGAFAATVRVGGQTGIMQAGAGTATNPAPKVVTYIVTVSDNTLDGSYDDDGTGTAAGKYTVTGTLTNVTKKLSAIKNGKGVLTLTGGDNVEASITATDLTLKIAGTTSAAFSLKVYAADSDPDVATKIVQVGGQQQDAVIYTTTSVTYPVKVKGIADGTYSLATALAGTGTATTPKNITVGNDNSLLTITNGSGTLKLNFTSAVLPSASPTDLVLTLKSGADDVASQAFSLVVDRATLTPAHLNGLGIQERRWNFAEKANFGSDSVGAIATLISPKAAFTGLGTTKTVIVYPIGGTAANKITDFTDGGFTEGRYVAAVTFNQGTNFEATPSDGLQVTTIVVYSATDAAVVADSINCKTVSGVYGNRQGDLVLLGNGSLSSGWTTGCRAFTKSSKAEVTDKGWFSASNPNSLLNSVASTGQNIKVTFTLRANTGVTGRTEDDVNVTVAQATPSSTSLDWTIVKNWLDTLSGRSTGAAFTPPAGGIRVPVGSNLTEPTSIVYSYRDANGRELAAAPWQKGNYTLWVAFPNTSNPNNTPWVAAPEPQQVGGYSIVYDSYVGRVNLSSGTAVYFADGQHVGYAFKRPGLNSGVAGRVDSIDTKTLSAIYYPGPAPSGGTPVALEWGKDLLFRESDSSLIVKVDQIGKVEFVVTLLGKTAATGGYIWEAPQQLWTAFINPKELKTGDVNVNGTVITYTGENIPLAVLSTKFTVSDGGVEVGQNVGWEFPADDNTNYNRNRRNAGENAAFIMVKGIGNYTTPATLVVPFTIERKTVSASIRVVNPSKVYDGTTKLDTNTAVTSPVTPHIVADFTGVTDADKNGTIAGNSANTFLNTKTYTITDVAYSTANVNSNCNVTAKITLRTANDSTARNYKFDGGDGNSATVRLLGEQIVELVPGAARGDALVPPVVGVTANTRIDSAFAFSIPNVGKDTTKHYFNGFGRGIGAVTFKGSIQNPGGDPLTVLYRYPENTKPYWRDSTEFAAIGAGQYIDTTFPPKDVLTGGYKVFVRVSGQGTNVRNGKYELGTYTILAPLGPTITAPSAAVTITKKLNQSEQFTVSARSPNGGTLKYQWFSYTSASDNVGTAIVGATDSTYTAPANEEKDFFYACKVTNSFPGAGASRVQIDETSTTQRITLRVQGVAKTLNRTNTIVTIDNSTPWTYTGFQIKPAGSTVVKVRYVKGPEPTDTVQLQEGSDYTLAYGLNVDVATGGSVRVMGTGDYESVVTERFNIVKKTPDRGDLGYSLSREYTGDTVNAGVAALYPRTGLGAISVKYDDKDSVPSAIGRYVLSAKVAGGANYLAGEDFFYVNMFEVKKATPSSANVSATIPTGHDAAVPGTKFGIDTNTIKIKGTGYGKVTVLYDDKTEIPSTGGTYAVKISLEGGANYNAGSVLIGNYIIKGVSVAAADREVPKTGATEVATVAPVKVTAASFSAGPSPASKAAGSIKFFSAKTVKSGSLYIFDANGNAVTKIKTNAGSGEIGSWNLTDKKGAAVAEGTYAVKGALAGKDGTKEKVSFVFSVAK